MALSLKIVEGKKQDKSATIVKTLHTIFLQPDRASDVF